MNIQDMEEFYSLGLGASIRVNVTATSARSTQLPRGRYRVQALRLGLLATEVWIKLGDNTVVAQADAPSMPLKPNMPWMEFTSGSGQDYVAAITDTGTAVLIITPVTRLGGPAR